MELRNTKTSYFGSLDWISILLYLLLVTIGVISIYASTYEIDNGNLFDFNEFSGKQITWVGFAFLLSLIILLIDSRMFETYAYPTYLIILLIMLLTVFIAPDIKGSRSWLVLGPVRFQPAEFGKFTTALALAKLFSRYNFKLNDSSNNYLRALTIIILPVILILAQKETGSALAYFALFFVLYREGMSGLVLLGAFCAILFFVLAIKYSEIFFMGIPLGEALVFIIIMILFICMIAFYCKKTIIARNVFLWFSAGAICTLILHFCGINIPGLYYFLISISVALIYCLLQTFKIHNNKMFLTVGSVIFGVLFLFMVNYAFSNILQPHQQQRIRVTLGLVEDKLALGYNVNQSKIAIGSGGFIGKGFLNGTQTKLKYVPEQHTDFIYCTIGEEEGFIGSVAVILLFLILILRIIHISERQPTIFGRVYGYCVASYFIFHICVNIGMVIGLCPVIGIPLPFFSYGGSSLWSFTILLFILLRIDASRTRHHTY